MTNFNGRKTKLISSNPKEGRKGRKRKERKGGSSMYFVQAENGFFSWGDGTSGDLLAHSAV